MVSTGRWSSHLAAVDHLIVTGKQINANDTEVTEEYISNGIAEFEAFLASNTLVAA
jgi:hypothetical protein